MVIWDLTKETLLDEDKSVVKFKEIMAQPTNNKCIILGCEFTLNF